MKIAFHERGWEDFLFWATQDKQLFRKLVKLIEDTKRHPHEGIGKPEPLRGNLMDFWSRRIDEKHRMVYYVDNDTMHIAQCRFHYSDK